jgi:molybdenum cofactor biosynthesis enzyme MoaA
MVRFVSIDVGEGRAHGCARCAARSSAAYHSVDTVREAVERAFAGWDASPGPNVLLTGPEPFAHRELPALVSACVQAGAERVAIETDGGALSVEPNANGVLHAGVRQLLVRVLATDDSLADRLSAVPGTARAAEAGVRAFLAGAAAGDITVAVTAVVPVCSHNLVSLPTTVAGCARWGVHGVRLVATQDLPTEAAAVAAAACDTGMVNRLWVECEGIALPETHRLHAAAESLAPPDDTGGGRR